MDRSGRLLAFGRMPKVTVVWRLRPGGSSRRSYTSRKVVELPVSAPAAGTRYDILPKHEVFDGRFFVVDRLRNDEVISRRVTLANPDDQHDLAMRVQLVAEGWTVGFDDTDEDENDSE
jgi:hypothetical protein